MAEMAEWLKISLQLLAALVLLIVMYIITLTVLNIDALVADKGVKIKPMEKTMLLDGYATPSSLFQLEYNTVNPNMLNYKKMSRSTSNNGGAAFTYQFWLKVESASDEMFKNTILFYRGDKNKYKLGYYTQDGSQYKLKLKLPADHYVACPMIMFGNSYKELKVRFNTNNDVFNEIYINMDQNAVPSARKNLLSILPLTWTLMTFVFEDNYSYTNNAENGIKFTMYVNDVPYWSESASSNPAFRNDFLKVNDGNFYFMPTIKENSSEFLKMGNLVYYNYPVTHAEVKSTFSSGAPKHHAMKGDTSGVIKPSYVSALNKVDMYNY